MNYSSLLRALVCGAGIALLGSAQAQDGTTCPSDWTMSDAQLQGHWTASIEGQPGSLSLELGPHPEWQGTVKGYVLRGDARLPMVGDVNEGAVTLEESADGVHITGTWLGQVVAASCGREIRGDYLPGEEARSQPFVLRKRSEPGTPPYAPR
ncbi:hypothetical protein [Comamonas guangdongensis]|uniref:Uncharacterized protein n=1 Tax=Comamonas guangdongensis TaxID=510515 RepID=A0ABV3ZRI8_9BURK